MNCAKGHKADRPPVHPARVQFFGDGRSPDSRLNVRFAPSQAVWPSGFARSTYRSQLRGQSRNFTAFPIRLTRDTPTTITKAVSEAAIPIN